MNNLFRKLWAVMGFVNDYLEPGIALWLLVSSLWVAWVSFITSPAVCLSAGELLTCPVDAWLTARDSVAWRIVVAVILLYVWSQRRENRDI